VTYLEEAPSILPDLLLGREYKTLEYSVSCRSLTHKPESTRSTNRNKVDPLVDFKLTKSTNQRKN